MFIKANPVICNANNYESSYNKEWGIFTIMAYYIGILHSYIVGHVTTYMFNNAYIKLEAGKQQPSLNSNKLWKLSKYSYEIPDCKHK